ncbi:MAG: histidine kinase [Bacteroidota bacterium]
MNQDTRNMKYICSLSICLVFFGSTLFSQVFMEKGNLKVGIKVLYENRIILIDSLCKGYHPETNIPIDLILPDGSSVELITDSIKTEDYVIMLRNSEPKYINRPIQKKNRYSISTGAGSSNNYSFIDKRTNDTLKISWTVDYGRPKLLNLYPANYFDNYIAHTYKSDFKDYIDTILYDWSQMKYIQRLNEQGLPVFPSFPHNHEGLFFVIHLSENAVVQMKGHHDTFHKVDMDNPLDLFLYEELSPGTYELIVQPFADAPESLWLKYPFVIEKPWWQKRSVQNIIGVSIFTILMTLIIAFLLVKQKRREKELAWKQQLTDAELKAIRAQLNPHFLFNSLSSIQNLVTQQKNEQANLYITKLSRLLRQVLSSSERQFQELEEELRLIKLYLELEQLRFPFSWQINVDDSVDSNVLIPGLLLQPYVENAVKHGVAGNPEGEILIQINKESNHLNIEILDNGQGLASSNNHSKGLDLGKNRIQKLNNADTASASVEIRNRTDSSGVIVKINLPI